MAHNYYSEINLHLVWHTKGSSTLLSPTVEPVVHKFIRKRLIETPGVFIHEIGGIETHVHIAVSIAPTILISDLVGQLKGASSHHANHSGVGKVLDWQAGYGVVSFGTGDLPWVCEYIRNKREHHQSRRSFDRLERIDPLAPETVPVHREPP